ncbi:MAG: hypothetical protein EHM41_13780 [Chloroflexi bacterium]|nr:MAG: hypothetical protein EHM41_13780 [Chloroflexota bacterium]
MLQTLDEVKAVELQVGQPINGVDNPNLASVDSTAVIVSPAADEVGGEEKKEEKKDEKAPVTAKPPDNKKDEGKEPESKETPPPVKGVEKRIAELTKKMRTAERERDFERTKREEAEKKVQELQSQIPATDKPKKEDFDDEDGYIEALTAWTVKETLRQSQTKVAGEVKTAEEREEVAEAYQTLDNAMDKGREKFEDFDTRVMAKDLVITPGMVEVALLSETAEEILYFLGSNPDISAEIAQMPDKAAARAIGKIEAQLAKASEEAKAGGDGKPKPNESTEGQVEKPPVHSKKVKSDAPAPINPLRTGDGGEKRPEDMSPAEYRAWRENRK